MLFAIPLMEVIFLNMVSGISGTVRLPFMIATSILFAVVLAIV